MTNHVTYSAKTLVNKESMVSLIDSTHSGVNAQLKDETELNDLVKFLTVASLPSDTVVSLTTDDPYVKGIAYRFKDGSIFALLMTSDLMDDEDVYVAIEASMTYTATVTLRSKLDGYINLTAIDPEDVESEYPEPTQPLPFESLYETYMRVTGASKHRIIRDTLNKFLNNAYNFEDVSILKHAAVTDNALRIILDKHKELKDLADNY